MIGNAVSRSNCSHNCQFAVGIVQMSEDKATKTKTPNGTFDNHITKPWVFTKIFSGKQWKNSRSCWGTGYGYTSSYTAGQSTIQVWCSGGSVVQNQYLADTHHLFIPMLLLKCSRQIFRRPTHPQKYSYAILTISEVTDAQTVCGQ